MFGINLRFTVNNQTKYASMHYGIHLVSICLIEISLALLRIWNHCWFTWLPASWTHLSMFVRKLESLKESECFIHISSNRKIINSDLSQLALSINDEQTTESQALVFLENSISLAYGHVLVSKEGNLHVSQASFLAASLAPSKVRKVRVGGGCDDSTVVGLKLSSSVIERDDLGGADKGEVKGVEEENDILAFVAIKTDFFELSVDNSSSLELWCSHLWLKCHSDAFMLTLCLLVEMNQAVFACPLDPM